MGSRVVRLAGPFSVVAAMLIATPALAAGPPSFAGPSGSGDDCTQASPCELRHAISHAITTSATEVIVESGDYTLSSEVDISGSLSVHGEAGAPPPVLHSSAPIAVSYGDGSGTLSDLSIDHNPPLQAGIPTGTGLLAGSALVERVFVHSTGSVACGITNFSTVRDSVCWDAATAGSPRGVLLSGGGAQNNIGRLRNVTAVASDTSSGVGVMILAGAHAAIDARNVIAHGGNFDTRTTLVGNAGVSAHITFTSSDYATAASIGGANSTITPAGSGDNVIAPASFANADAGDFHELGGSVTIDAGTTDAALGSLDLDRVPRTQGAAPDIGAYEFVPPVEEPGSTSDTEPPDTSIVRAPNPRTRHHRAVVTFTATEAPATFMCSLDAAGFAPCDSPLVLTHVKRGKHTLTVEAVDAANNVDPTPAQVSWRVVRRHHRHHHRHHHH